MEKVGQDIAELDLPGRVPDRILLLTKPGADAQNITDSLTQLITSASVNSVESLEKLHKELEQSEYDLVLIDFDAAGEATVESVRSFKLRDHDPTPIVIGTESSPQVLARLHSAGAQRCVLKHENWINELAPTVRHVLRLRRLEGENRSLLARLSEKLLHP